MAALTVAAGYAARTRGSHPALIGSAPGAVFGLVSGIRSVTRHTTAAQVRLALDKTHRTSPIGIGELVRIANSPAVRALDLALTLVVWAVIGLLLGAIAGAIAGGREA